MSHYVACRRVQIVSNSSTITLYFVLGSYKICEWCQKLPALLASIEAATLLICHKVAIGSFVFCFDMLDVVRCPIGE